MAESRTRTRTRVTKHPMVRRDELLDTALDLCRRHGFAAMNVEQITRSAGVAKGTFYHYFASKDAMLEELVLRFGDALFGHLTAAAEQPGGSAADRLGALMHAAAAYKANQADAAYAAIAFTDGNLALRHRLFQAWRDRARQVLLPVIRNGVRDGSLQVVDAETTTDIVLLLWFEAADQLWARGRAAPDVDAFVTIMTDGARALYQAQERVLGLVEGTFTLPLDPPFITMTRTLYYSLKENR